MFRHDLTSNIRTFVQRNLGRPLHMLFTEPIVGLLCVYMSFQFGLLYCFVLASPWVYQRAYGFGLEAQSLSFLGLAIGCCTGSFILILVEKRVYQPRLLLYKSEGTLEKFPPEERLYAAMFGSICLPSGLFIFAWTARPDIHWIVPMLAQGLAMIGSLTIYVPSGMYMMETYGALYGASASGANSLLRYLLAASFPLFTLQMFQHLGTGWASSLLGFITVAMAPIPWCFRRWGRGLRSGSRYVVDD